MRRKLLIGLGAVVVIVVVVIAVRILAYDPEIRDWHDLYAIRDNLSGSYVLMNDLDATAAGYEELAGPTVDGGKGWQPIGAWRSAFSGSFDGQGHEIRDLFINRPDEDYVGLFGSVGEGGVISNVGVIGAAVTGKELVGGLVGHNSGTVSDSCFGGSVNGERLVGGLAGGNVDTVSDCYSTGGVTGNEDVGGLVGINAIGFRRLSYSDGAMTGGGDVTVLPGSKPGTVSNSYSTANVTGGQCVGGLVGSSMGTVSHSHATSNVSGNSSVGGPSWDTKLWAL